MTSSFTDHYYVKTIIRIRCQMQSGRSFFNNEGSTCHCSAVGRAGLLRERQLKIIISSPGSSLKKMLFFKISLAAVKSLNKSLFAADYGINVTVENHGGYSCRGSWLSSVIQSVGMARFTIPIWAQKN